MKVGKVLNVLNNGQTEILVCIGFIVIAVVAIALIPETGGASLLLLGA